MTENQIFAGWGLIDVSDFLLEHKFPQTLLEEKKNLAKFTVGKSRINFPEIGRRNREIVSPFSSTGSRVA